jgi:hypothetical protein
MEPTPKSETFGAAKCDFSAFLHLLPHLQPPTMSPRAFLGTIDGNSGYSYELTPNQRGKIKGTKLSGAIFIESKCLPVMQD